jgi:hypothetical protein
MNETLPTTRDYRFLDGETDRQALCADIHRVRREVLAIAERVPESQWYEPRYHGWTLAAMLGHLHQMDRLTMLWIQAAMVGIRIPSTPALLNRFNDAMSRVFRKRVMQTTVKSIQQNEKNIADFIMRVPVKQFSKTLYDPAIDKTLTVEQAIQEFFLYHWQDHLADMRAREVTSHE